MTSSVEGALDRLVGAVEDVYRVPEDFVWPAELDQLYEVVRVSDVPERARVRTGYVIREAVWQLQRSAVDLDRIWGDQVVQSLYRLAPWAFTPEMARLVEEQGGEFVCPVSWRTVVD